MNADSPKKVVYLIGAGASHGCVARATSQQGILMQDLSQPLNARLHDVIKSEFDGNPDLEDLANSVMDEDTDFEQVITFLDGSPSRIHRQFAEKMRETFHSVLASRLSEIREELGNDPIDLYSALIDMYEIPNCPETLMGIMTLNYDDYIEQAVRQVTGENVDFGFVLEGAPTHSKRHRLLKLHGSFGWRDTWPVVLENSQHPLWIPPGIQKAKDMFPFNVLWGLAREMLTCDVLRIIGCRLGPNDWDLIALLFTTRHVGSPHRPYSVEVIDAPANAFRLAEQLPYLNVRSLLELPEVGSALVGEFSGSEPRSFGDLSDSDRDSLMALVPERLNWFEVWLRQMAEWIYTELGSVSTNAGLIERFLEGD